MIPLALLLFLVAGGTADLPKGWKSCRRSVPDYDKCLEREVSAAIMSLMQGNKNLGVLPLEPLRISALQIPKHGGSVAVDLSFSNMDSYGIKDFKIRKIKTDWKTMEAKVYLPRLTSTGDYKVDGKVLVLPIVGTGKVNLTSVDLDLNVKLVFKRTKTGGKEYFQVDKFTVEFFPKRMYMYLTNLFNGDKALGDSMNAFLDENWKLIVDELRPGMEDGLSQTFTIIANKILAKIPAQELDRP